MPCNKISAEWGAQRIKGLSLRSAVSHFLAKALGFRRRDDLEQKTTQTSLIERFLYPKFGPGQLWEHAASLVCKAGGSLHFGVKVDRINVDQQRIISIEGIDEHGERQTFSGDYFFSTMPIRDLLRAFSVPVPRRSNK